MTQTQQMAQEVTLKYYPFPKQMLFHQDRYKVRHRAVFSGVGGGKTICGCFEMLSMLLENPKSVGYIFEPTYKMVRRILIPTLESKYLLGHPIDSNPIVSAISEATTASSFWMVKPFGLVAWKSLSLLRALTLMLCCWMRLSIFASLLSPKMLCYVG